MSTYGVNKYGTPTVYGPSVTASVSSGAIQAVPTGYGTVTLTWSIPTGSWAGFRLVRNPYGYPTDTDDGVVVFTSIDGTPQTFTDTGLVQGREYYYTVFVLSSTGNVWISVSSVSVLSVKDFNTYSIMWQALPLAVRSAARSIADTSSENKDLSDFIRLVAFEYDVEKTQAYLINKLYDTRTSPQILLQALMLELGLTLEPHISTTRLRVLAQNILRIYQSKGSVAGLRDFVKAFSGYDTTVSTGVNLFLTYNDSSFEDSIGNWASTTATLTVAPPSTIPPYTEPLSPIGFPNRHLGSLSVSALAAGTISATCGANNPAFEGIPVIASTAYTFSIYAHAATTAQNVTLSINWYTSLGVFISTTTGTSVPDTTSSWTRVDVTGTSPANAVYAVPEVQVVASTIGEVHYFDAGQFEQGPMPTTYQDARRIEILMAPNRINELLNPNFTVDYSNWNFTNYTTISIVTSSGTNPHEALNGNAVEVYPATTANVDVYSSNITTISPNDTYTFSIYSTVASYGTRLTTSDSFEVSIKWYDSSNNLLSETTGEKLEIIRDTSANWSTTLTALPSGYIGIESDTLKFKVGDGVTTWNLLPYASRSLTYVYNTSAGFTATYVLSRYAIGVETDTLKFKIGDGVTQWSALPYTTSIPAWIRLSVTSQAPSTASYAVANLYWTPSEVSMSAIIDEALFEKSPGVEAFFDGSSGYEDLTGLKWEGTANASRSALYRNLNAVSTRLIELVPNYMTLGSTFYLEVWPYV